jgi:hypothetical protein
MTPPSANEAMGQKKTSWGLIILGIAALVLVVGVAMVAIVGYVIYQQFAFQATSATEVSAAREFDRAALRFAGQRPYLVIRHGEPEIATEEGPSPGAPVEALHVMVWQPDEGKLVKLNIPFWLLRLTKGKPIRVTGSDAETSAMRLNIRPEQLERRGPGLVLDHRTRAGERVLIWAE